VLEFSASDVISACLAYLTTVDVSEQNYISSNIFKVSFIHSYLSKKDGYSLINEAKAFSIFLRLLIRFWW
jgi:hypothetical protein